jgi:hypothetical protein
MTFLRKALALSAVLAVAVALFGSVATTASATGVPYTSYGTGSNLGDVITILSNNTSCVTVTANSEGNWGPVSLDATDGNCSFQSGGTISFCLNGTVADQSEIWNDGGAPSNVQTGTVLTVTETGQSPGASSESSSTGNCGGGSSNTESCTENCNPGETPEFPDGGVPEEVPEVVVPEEVPEVVVPEVGVPEIVVEVGVPEVVVPEVAVTVTAPAPGATGNAGLAQNTGTNSIATLLLSAFAVVVVAGGRVASRMR